MTIFKFSTLCGLFILLITDNVILKSDAGLIFDKLKEIRQNIRNTIIPQKKTYSVVDGEKNYQNPDAGTYNKIDEDYVAPIVVSSTTSPYTKTEQTTHGRSLINASCGSGYVVDRNGRCRKAMD